jgi:hypothetical protein
VAYNSKRHGYRIGEAVWVGDAAAGAALVGLRKRCRSDVGRDVGRAALMDRVLLAARDLGARFRAS